MYFLIDNKLKIIFGWSAKCGCSHIKKIFWYLQNGKEDNEIHTEHDVKSLPNNISDFIIILIIRNPYSRIISGFLNKYSPNGSFKIRWKYDTITFSKFVDELVKNDWKMIDFHHFTPQTSEKFDKSLINSAKELKVYDIKSIDYTYIEKLYNKTIPESLINFKGGHEKTNKIDTFENFVYDLDMKDYDNKNVETYYFYNEYLKKKFTIFILTILYFLKNMDLIIIRYQNVWKSNLNK